MFGESIYYNDASPLSSTTPQYNGNISGITWRSRIEASGKPGVSTAPQGNSYDYDNLDRHFKNNYFTYSGGSFNPAAGRPLTETISGYDLMGNIQEMYRVDKNATTINDQFYYYHPYSNKVDSIYDEGTQSITGTFTYDGNGNLTYDSRKDIHITYNYLDLPDTVSKGSSKLVFTYDAAGNKLYKQLIVGGTVVAQRHYVENLEATATTSMSTDGRIDFALMDEGRIVNTPDSGYRYEYYLTDHLGNNRVMFRTDSLGHVRLSMVQNYYPFGSDMGDSTMNYSLNPNNFYKYSNKELQPELDLDTYDFGARHYDAILGRWMGIDPLSWLADGQSPYNYTENNPMNMVDPDGMQPNPGSWGGVPLGGITSGGSWGSGGDWGGAGLSAGVGLYNAWNAFSFKDPTHLNMNFGGVQGNGAIRSSIPQGMIPHPPPPPVQPTISQWQPNMYDKWKDSGFLGKFTYDIADGLHVTTQVLVWPYEGYYHLNGEEATPRDRVSAFANTATLAIPLGRGGIAIKAVAENVAEHAVIDLGERVAAKSSTSVIKGFTKHGIDQAIERGFKSNNILKIVKEGNAVKALGRHGPQIRFSLGGNTVILNAQGKVVTVFSKALGGHFIPF